MKYQVEVWRLLFAMTHRLVLNDAGGCSRLANSLEEAVGKEAYETTYKQPMLDQAIRQLHYRKWKFFADVTLN